jgi:hypothetical protein
MCSAMNDPTGIINEALKSPQTNALYQAIVSRGPIAFELGGADEQWSSKTVDGKTTITATPTKHPAAALYHELLHAELKLDGYGQYLTFVSMDEKLGCLTSIGEALDNELQHHRMIGDFLRAGFAAEEFYHDDDVDALKHARNSIRGLKKREAAELFLLPFLTVIAPGGHGTDDERRSLKNMFQANSTSETWTILSGVEQAFTEWAHQSSLDPGDTIIRILRMLGGYEHTWVGASQDFPDGGKFVAQAFTAQDAMSWHSQQKNQ